MQVNAGILSAVVRNNLVKPFTNTSGGFFTLKTIDPVGAPAGTPAAKLIENLEILHNTFDFRNVSNSNRMQLIKFFNEGPKETIARTRRLKFVNNLVLLNPANTNSANLRAGIGLEKIVNATSTTNWASTITEQVAGNTNKWLIRGNIFGLGGSAGRAQYGVDINYGTLETESLSSFLSTYVAAGNTSNTELNVSVDSTLMPGSPPSGVFVLLP